LNTLHIHVDESGDLNFAKRGSRFYIFTAVWTYHPLPLGISLHNLRFGYIKSGVGAKLSRFHACEDQQAHRDAVVDLILSENTWWFASIVIEKRKVNPTIREPEIFYPQFLNSILRFIFRGNLKQGTTNVLVYTDSLPLKSEKEKKIASFTIEDVCKAELGEIPFRLMHHASDSNSWLQIADYCSWSICRKWERGDVRTYSRLKARLQKTELDPMSLGRTIYY
jgi:hypothetical protein